MFGKTAIFRAPRGLAAGNQPPPIALDRSPSALALQIGKHKHRRDRQLDDQWGENLFVEPIRDQTDDTAKRSHHHHHSDRNEPKALPRQQSDPKQGDTG